MLLKGKYFLGALLTFICLFLGPGKLVKSILKILSGTMHNIHTCSVSKHWLNERERELTL